MSRGHPVRLAIALLLPSAAPAGALAQEPLACPDTVLAGSVTHGESFAAPFARGLVFRLDAAAHPSNPQGWTIRVTPAEEPAHDYAAVATPPYRFANPRYVDTGYGATAEEAVAWEDRAFRFVASASDYEAAINALDVLLWSAGHADEEIERARAAFERMPAYAGRFLIERASTSLAEGPPGVIESMDFRVQLCLPDG